MVDNKERIHAYVFLTQSSPKTKDWLDAYKQYYDTNPMLNHLTISTKLFESVLINSVHEFYCIYLPEQQIKRLDNKLICYIPVGRDNRLVMLLIVPQGLRKFIFTVLTMLSILVGTLVSIRL